MVERLWPSFLLLELELLLLLLLLRILNVEVFLFVNSEIRNARVEVGRQILLKGFLIFGDIEGKVEGETLGIRSKSRHFGDIPRPIFLNYKVPVLESVGNFRSMEM